MNDLELERLVDGDLSPEEYRSLLTSLEDEQGGWRQCALAFLEDQALAGEFHSVRAALDLRGKRQEENFLPKSRRIDERWTFFAIAASFLIALGVGIVGPRFLPALWPDGRLAGNLGPQLGSESPVDNGAVHEIGNLRLVMDDAGGESARSGQVPVYEVGSDVARYLSDQRPALGPEFIDLLRQNGFEVHREQQYFPASLEDGRQLIVPVEGYQITPVGRKY